MSETFYFELPETRARSHLESGQAGAPYVEPEVADDELTLFETMRQHLLAELDAGAEEYEGPSDEQGTYPLSRLFRLPLAAFDALARGAYGTVVALAGAAGYRSVNDLTNIIFYFRHPDIVGRKIRSDEPELRRSWLEIRDTIVVPALRSTATPSHTAPSGRTSLSAENLSWYGPGTATPELMAFMRAVYDRHVARSKGPFVDTLPDSALARIEGHHSAQVAAAQAAIRLLAAARADLRAAGREGREQVGITSAYRSARRQFEIWQGKGGGGKRGFPFYYRATEKARSRFADPHGPEAVAYLASVMAKWIAAPGYSNHQDGLAIDFGAGRAGAKGLRKIGTGDWFHGWLVRNARRFGYQPYEQEPWHWIYRPDTVQEAEFGHWDEEPVPWEAELGIMPPASLVYEKFNDESIGPGFGDEEAGFDETAGRLDDPPTTA